MHTKCPACGAVNSLDSIINNDDASIALVAIAELDAELGKAIIKYCGLFRPAKTQLTFARLATLINELLPSIKTQRIERNKQLFDAPPEAWIHAVNVLLEKRQDKENPLKLPMKSHGYLFEVISKYKPAIGITEVDPISNNAPAAPQGKKSRRAALLQSMKR
ncbi:MAG: hypothetical protein KGV50_00260 [Gammaproteobacteria bacterium]|nr:hypothetical protein [Gammaproteobacteria bacterium]